VENAIALLTLVSVVLGQRWVWVIAFFIAGAASLFATFASIIYFQILAAVSFLFLWLTCWVIMVSISRSWCHVRYGSSPEETTFVAQSPFAGLNRTQQKMSGALGSGRLAPRLPALFKLDESQ